MLPPIAMLPRERERMAMLPREREGMTSVFGFFLSRSRLGGRRRSEGGAVDLGLAGDGLLFLAALVDLLSKVWASYCPSALRLRVRLPHPQWHFFASSFPITRKREV